MAADKYVPKTHPTASAPEALGAISTAYQRLFGHKPRPQELLVLAAHSSLETGRWKHMPCWNVAGLKASVSGPGYYFDAETFEVENGVRVKKVQHFRAYPSLDAGCFDWLSLLAHGYPDALVGARDGDVAAFVEGLWQGWGRGAKYFTEHFPVYSTGVRREFEWLRNLGLDLTDLTEPVGPGEVFYDEMMKQALDE